MSKKNFLILITIIILSFMLPGFSTAAQPISPVIHKINNFEKEGYYYDNNFYPLDETVRWQDFDSAKVCPMEERSDRKQLSFYNLSV